MVTPDASLLLKQRLRLRELAKYYEAVLPRGHVQHSIQAPFPDIAIEEFRPSPPSLAVDPQLTALAQLAAFRTNCQRSCISIIDHQAQHVIAEATRSISVFDQKLRDADDALLFGAQSLPLGWSLCSGTLGVYSGEPGPYLDDPSNHANKDFVIIADLRSEGKTKNVPAVRYLAPVLRYYVQVPLRSPSGSVLGAICTFDSKPRKPDPHNALALQEVARLVVQHLENSRMKEDHRRAELLLSGLSHFIQGQDSMSAWSEATPGQEAIPSLTSQQARLSVSSLTSLPTSTVDRSSAHGTTAHALTDPTDTSASTAATTARNFSGSEDDVTKVSSVSSLVDEIDVGFDPFPANEQADTDAAQSLRGNSVDVRHTFSRASNLIREAMDLDATIFLEVPHNDRFKAPKSRHRKAEVSGARSGEKSPVPTSDSGGWSDSSDASPVRDGSNTEGSFDTQVLCHRLGYATRLKSSLAASIVTKPFLTIPAALLTRLALRYPQGHIFHFDSYGSVSSGDDEELAILGERSNSSHQKRLSSRLHRMLPDARSLIFLPMYDNDKQQIYAGFIGMSACPTRALQKYESTYVSAFVNSLMCEVMRLEALKTDKAKSDFISSISHELRSPLHGILASSQLLAESNIKPAQMEFIQMVDMCARTLLDTMDHLLDHAKINHFTQQHTQRREKRQSLEGGKGSQPRPYSLVASTNMLPVIEETVASMAASSNQMLQSVEGTRSRSGPDQALTVPVMLDIPPSEYWNFDTEAGSWRRMIMNLVGNSLKYTQQGHVQVSFGLRKQSDSKFFAELNVIDTGQGISEEYLKHRLYTPFSQENNLSVGTGLGLSLVRQIVSSLRGDIRITSEAGSGTKVSIKVPLTVSKDDEVQQRLESCDPDLLAAMSGQTFAFSGFDERPSLSEAPTGISSPHMKTLSAMKNSLFDLLTNWFHSRPVAKSASISIVEESFLESNLKDFDRAGRSLLVIGLEGRRSTVVDQIKQAAYVYLLPPIGPTRMAAALKSLFQARDASSSAISEAFIRPKQHKRSSSSSITELTVPNPHTPEHKEALLLVDDNDINLRILVTCIGRLKLTNVDLLTASNGKEAVDKYTAATENGVNISVVFMDISMPIMNGFEATRQIRSLEKGKGISKSDSAKIMALTGLASQEALNEVKASGFDSYLRKPVNLRTIREVLAAARI